MNEEAKFVLKELMSKISESTWCAGWLIDLEFVLWKYTQHPPNLLTEAEGKALLWLAEQAGGWWVWIDKLGPQFVGMNEWWGIYKQWEEQQKEKQT